MTVKRTMPRPFPDSPYTYEDSQQYIGKFTIIDKIEFSGITKEQVKSRLEYLKTIQVPNRTVLRHLSYEEVLECWFKNWLHPQLKSFFRKSPSSKVGVSAKRLEMDAKLDLLHFYENGQHQFSYTIADIEEWLGENEPLVENN